jgi:hypothetical protein
MKDPKLKTDGPAWQAAKEFGVDMAQLETSLMKTPWERIQQHSRALNMAVMLREAMEKKREARSEGPPQRHPCPNSFEGD